MIYYPPRISRKDAKKLLNALYIDATRNKDRWLRRRYRAHYLALYFRAYPLGLYLLNPFYQGYDRLLARLWWITMWRAVRWQSVCTFALASDTMPRDRMKEILPMRCSRCTRKMRYVHNNKRTGKPMRGLPFLHAMLHGRIGYWICRCGHRVDDNGMPITTK